MHDDIKHLARIIFVFVSLIAKTNAQDFSYTYSVYFGAQVTLNFKMGKNAFKQNFPGIRAYTGFHAYNRIGLGGSTAASFNVGSSLTLYNKSLGNSLNLNFQDNQIDWTTNFTGGVIWGDDTPLRLLQTINNSPFYNLHHDKEYAIHLGTNFIMNNHSRNQTNGSFSFTTQRFSLTYYNDGPFFNYLGLGDNFDRYWTGGLMLYLHDSRRISSENNIPSSIAFNRLEFSFDQFTGYHPQMYELTGIFGADIQDYDLYQQFKGNEGQKLSLRANGRDGYDYNASQYALRYNHNEFFGVQLGVIGSLRDMKRERYYALQDIIHVLTRAPIHPNKDFNRMQLGLNYTNRLWDIDRSVQ